MFLLFTPTGEAQKVINEYSRILSIQNADTTDVDSVQVSDTSIFEPGDTVLFIEMKGVQIYDPFTHPGFPTFWGTIYNRNNIGIYNILLINKVSNNYVIFTTNLRKLNPMKPGEVCQLVKIRGGKTVYEVNEPHTCKTWDPVTGAGGVFALIAGRKIVLNNVIDVTGKGFLGGDPDSSTTDYFEGSCSGAIDGFHLESHVDSSGRKGEGIVYEGYPYVRGNWFSANSGGGGNGKYSGGGGGGNFGKGGNGGKESQSCSPYDNLSGTGYFLDNFYDNSGLSKNRIIMGGGGGTSTQNPDSLRYATKGGNGGGIIILI
ncbi:MAG: hypothetical protein AMS27_16695, partial [Bacteroides sp. SM23_62_1]